MQEQFQSLKIWRLFGNLLAVVISNICSLEKQDKFILIQTNRIMDQKTQS